MGESLITDKILASKVLMRNPDISKYSNLSANPNKLVLVRIVIGFPANDIHLR